jgi:hypothetical protein
MIAYTSSQLETDHPSYAIHSSHDSFPLPPRKVYTELFCILYITYTRLLSQWTYLRVQLPAEQSILVLPQSKGRWAVALSASKPVSPEAPINATRNKTATSSPNGRCSRVDFEFCDSRSQGIIALLFYYLSLPCTAQCALY